MGSSGSGRTAEPTGFRACALHAMDAGEVTFVDLADRHTDDTAP